MTMIDEVVTRSRAAQAGNGIARGMLAEFEKELGTTRRFLERVPGDRLTWRPHEKSMTAGQLALHIAVVPMAVVKLSLVDESAPPDFSKGNPQPQTLHEVMGALEQSVAFVRQALPTVDDERMEGEFKFVREGRTLRTFVRAEFLRAGLLNHWYHHRGQLGVYLRLLGAVVPSSYGPSGDESPF